VTAYREAHLSCNGKNEPDLGGVYPGSRFCRAEFRAAPELGFVSSFPVLRREARKAGWTYVRWPSGLRSLDKDFCPDHKPEDTTPDAEAAK
jgi:hypothetical protein